MSMRNQKPNWTGLGWTGLDWTFATPDSSLNWARGVGFRVLGAFGALLGFVKKKKKKKKKLLLPIQLLCSH
jgi:hypothetical protein